MLKLLGCLRLVLIVLFFLIGSNILPAEACTAWGAAGEKTTNGGAILAKNRDWVPEANEIRLIVPKKGFTYLGLFPVKGAKIHGVVAGINEKGLALVSATADSMPKNIRNVGEKHINEGILTSYDSVDALLKNREVLLKGHPAFYMIADRTKIALIEVALRREISIKTVDNGVLYHTNHYIDERLLWANKKADTSSRIRFNRIQHLLTTLPSAFAIDDFIAFSEDTQDGPDNSIWRRGGSPKKERTLASWIVYIPKEGYPELYIKLANPEEAEKTYNLLLDAPFWTEGLQ